ncbi:MAG: PAS domain-containing protein [Anaeromyxobacteraceae bacterium]
MSTALSRTNRSDLAFDSLPDPVVVVDEAGRVDRVNRAALLLFGPRIGDAAEHGDAVARVLPWLAAAVRCVLAGADEAGVEGDVLTADGVRSLAARVRRLPAACGVSGAVVRIEDETERRLLEARLRLAEQDEALGALAADLAHQVNNPLACVVSGLAFVAAEHARLSNALAGDLREAQAALEEARAAAQRVGRVVRSLETFGRPAAAGGHSILAAGSCDNGRHDP